MVTFRQVALAGVLAYYALGELMTRVQLGPVSLNAFVSMALSATLVVLIPILVQHRRLVGSAFWFLTLWLFVSFATTLAQPMRSGAAGSVELGLQQLLAWLLFIGSILVGAWMSAQPSSYRVLPRSLIAVGFFWSFAVVGLSGVEYTIGGFQILGPRPMAALLLIAFSLSYGRFFCSRHWRPALAAGVALAALVISESRSASLAAIAAILAIETSRLRLWRPQSWTATLKGGAIAALALGLAWSYAPLRNRVIPLLEDPGSLVSETAAAAVSTQGRSSAWPALIAHSLESPIAGHGVGTASVYTYDITRNERFSHPHNEYIRILHDAGAVGLALLLAGFLQSWSAARRAQRSLSILPDGRALAAGVIGVIPACLILFLTDNVGFYTFVMVPFGVLIGLVLGIGSRGGRARSSNTQ